MLGAVSPVPLMDVVGDTIPPVLMRGAPPCTKAPPGAKAPPDKALSSGSVSVRGVAIDDDRVVPSEVRVVCCTARRFFLWSSSATWMANRCALDAFWLATCHATKSSCQLLDILTYI
jgi:hypothetical protein